MYPSFNKGKEKFYPVSHGKLLSTWLKPFPTHSLISKYIVRLWGLFLCAVNKFALHVQTLQDVILREIAASGIYELARQPCQVFMFLSEPDSSVKPSYQSGPRWIVMKQEAADMSEPTAHECGAQRHVGFPPDWAERWSPSTLITGPLKTFIFLLTDKV